MANMMVKIAALYPNPLDLVDVELFLVAQKVESGLRNHDTQPCLSWCHENRSKLKKLKSSLEFRTHLQNFIELVRGEKRMEAIRYARKHFSNVEEAHVKEVQVAMTLLAFQPGTSCKKYEKLFSESRWSDLIKLFHQENYSLHQLNGQSMLSVTLQAGLSSLKTPHCGKSDQVDLRCPVCTEPLGELARPLPYSHCAQSHLICTLSGKVMDDNNPPMALPNGYVYGENALRVLATENNGSVICPKTNETFQFSEAKKVFIM
ncbi:E3 ubiquitin-protein transferase MAEA-like isoform X2 [Dysidea avara]|uniref:E3 ubiquitin-protein transferase MAEA-like isoform X2 n=1 Tax=Dysidea avara TaxID=196820 RepID=UPI00331DD0E7